MSAWLCRIPTYKRKFDRLIAIWSVVCLCVPTVCLCRCCRSRGSRFLYAYIFATSNSTQSTALLCRSAYETKQFRSVCLLRLPDKNPLACLIKPVVGWLRCYVTLNANLYALCNVCWNRSSDTAGYVLS